jgi:hypothetical protein
MHGQLGTGDLPARRSPLEPLAKVTSPVAYDVGNARIWGGIHYRSAVEDGIQLGMKVADQVLAHHFHEID